LGVLAFVILVQSTDSCSMAFSCVWLHSLIQRQSYSHVDYERI
jgi:hypothetical protein